MIAELRELKAISGDRVADAFCTVPRQYGDIGVRQPISESNKHPAFGHVRMDPWVWMITPC